MDRFASVIIDISHEKLDKPYTYILPEELRNEVTAGSNVLVPFGNSNRTKKGYVVDISDENTSGFELKRIISAAPRGVTIEDELMELALWMKERYGCTFIRALKTVLPVKTVVKARKKKSTDEENGKKEYLLHSPNEAQQRVIDRFIRDREASGGLVYLLHGVTGSGKTDAYMHMIRRVLEEGKQVILLIPEISLTYQTIDRISSVFGARTAVIHSKLSQGERSEQMRRCRSGEADIIIGPRSAVFAPFRNIGLIVIDEEHDGAYKNETVPRYNTVDIAVHRAGIHNASVVLSSATPSPESFGKAREGTYVYLSLPERAGGAKLPVIDVVDMRKELASGNRSIFSDRLEYLIRDRLKRHEQVILFMNRRGYSNFVSCRSCGNAVKCPHCDISLKLHSGHRLKCHYCGYETEMPVRCPDCGSPYIAEFGAGTQKLEAVTKKLFPEARVARLDTDSASGRKASGEILRAMSEGNTDILIGTQMVVKGHDFPNVTLVGIVAADTSLYVSDYLSGQRTYELISQAAGRAGRGKREGRVVIQTYRPEHYAVECASENDYEAYFENEMRFRRIMNYPPAVHIWTIQLSSTDESRLNEMADAFARALDSSAEKENVSIIGPVEPAVYKIKDYYRKMIYVKSPDYDGLLRLRERTEKRLETEEGGAIPALYDFT